MSDTPETMAAHLRAECLRAGLFDIEDVEAEAIARWLDELVACREVLKVVAANETWRINGRGDPNGSGFDLQSLARAAIAKAEGQ